MKVTLLTMSLSAMFYSRQGYLPPQDILLLSPFHACIALATTPTLSICMHMHAESTARIYCTNVPCTYLALTQCLRALPAGTVLQLLQHLPYRQQLPATTAGHFSWWKLWVAFCLANAVLPFCALYTWLHARISWSGITYTKAGGCIVKVEHCSR